MYVCGGGYQDIIESTARIVIAISFHRPSAVRLVFLGCHALGCCARSAGAAALCVEFSIFGGQALPRGVVFVPNSGEHSQ